MSSLEGFFDLHKLVNNADCFFSIMEFLDFKDFCQIDIALTNSPCRDEYHAFLKLDTSVFTGGHEQMAFGETFSEMVLLYIDWICLRCIKLKSFILLQRFDLCYHKVQWWKQHSNELIVKLINATGKHLIRLEFNALDNLTDDTVWHIANNAPNLEYIGHDISLSASTIAEFDAHCLNLQLHHLGCDHRKFLTDYVEIGFLVKYQQRRGLITSFDMVDPYNVFIQYFSKEQLCEWVSKCVSVDLTSVRWLDWQGNSEEIDDDEVFKKYIVDSRVLSGKCSNLKVLEIANTNIHLTDLQSLLVQACELTSIEINLYGPERGLIDIGVILTTCKQLTTLLLHTTLINTDAPHAQMHLVNSMDVIAQYFPRQHASLTNLSLPAYYDHNTLTVDMIIAILHKLPNLVSLRLEYFYVVVYQQHEKDAIRAEVASLFPNVKLIL